MNSFKRTATMRLTALVIVLCMVFTPLSAQASQPTAKRDIANATVYANANYFQGLPVAPVLNIYLDGKALAEGEDFVVLAENNVNIGTASYCIVGIGDYYGYIKGEFTIGMPAPAVRIGIPTGSICLKMPVTRIALSAVMCEPSPTAILIHG